MWSIWKERNSGIFEGASVDYGDLLLVVGWRGAKWAIIREEFANLRLDDIVYNREDCLRCRVP